MSDWRNLPPETLTQAQWMDLLGKTKDASAWGDVCDRIKASNNGGYPAWWWPATQASGFARSVQQSWTVTPAQRAAEAREAEHDRRNNIARINLESPRQDDGPDLAALLFADYDARVSSSDSSSSSSDSSSSYDSGSSDSGSSDGGGGGD